MKTSHGAVKAVTATKAGSSYERLKAPLPLTTNELTKEMLEARIKSKFTLKVVPGDKKSAEYTKILYHINGTEDARSILQWKKDLETIRVGLNLKDAETVFKFTAQGCSGAAKDSYLARIQEIRSNWVHEVETYKKAEFPYRTADDDDEEYAERLELYHVKVAEFEKPCLEWHKAGIKEVLLDALPYKILQKQKRYMRRFMRKPKDMKVRVYAAHMMKINNDELPQLPPFRHNQEFDKEELTEIVLYGVPMSWQREMDRQNFDPDLQTYRDLIDFCERMEATDEVKHTIEKSDNSKKPKASGHSNSSKNTGKWCEYHKNHTHNTADCRQKKYHDNDGEAPKKSDNNKNKTWSRNAKYNQAITKKEVNAMIQKALGSNSQNETRKRANEELQYAESAEVQQPIVEFEILPNQPLGVNDIVEDEEAALNAAMDLDALDAEFAEFQKPNGELV